MGLGLNRLGFDRKRLKRREPLFPCYAFTPGCTCPGGSHVKDNWVCMVNHCTSHTTQHQIDREPVRPLEEPERRIRAEMDLLQLVLDDKTRDLKPHHRREIRAQLEDLDKELKDYIPTKYRPDPGKKGGRS